MATAGEAGPIQYAVGNDADDGDYSSALVAAVAGKKIRVIGLVATVLTTAGVFSLKSGSTTIFAAHLALGSPLVVMSTPGVGICETAAGVALTPNNATGVDSYVAVVYQLVEP